MALSGKGKLHRGHTVIRGEKISAHEQYNQICPVEVLLNLLLSTIMFGGASSTARLVG